MLVTHEREKLCHAIVFFAEHTKKLGKTKLFKLLYFLDFEHFKLTGRSVTGLNYFAWPKGPVPRDLFEEFQNPSSDFSECVSIESVLTLRGRMEKPTAKVPFNQKIFSRRELELMRQLAREYCNASAEAMIEATHLENRPWHEIYEVRGLRQEQIPYELALNKHEADEMARRIRERQEVIDNYNNNTEDGSRNRSVR